MTTGLEVLLFDVDGTLADTEDFHRKAFNLAFADAGLDWSWDQSLYKSLLAVTGGKERIRHYLDRHLPEVAMSDEDIAGLHARKTDFYTDMLAEGRVVLRPGESLDPGAFARQHPPFEPMSPRCWNTALPATPAAGSR